MCRALQKAGNISGYLKPLEGFVSWLGDFTCQTDLQYEQS